MIEESPWVRRARPQEASTVLEIIRAAFPMEIIERTVYGCHGVIAYIEATTSGNNMISPTFLVSGTGTLAVAVAEVAAEAGGLFLSYIATRADARSRGLGSNLLLAAAKLHPVADIATMALDVFHENTRARDWYGEVGFEAIGERGWWELELTAAAHIATSISGWAQAEICHRIFGFSEFLLHAADHSYRVGRLGSNWFRITSLNAVEDPQVMATLAVLDPQRKILAMGNMDDPYASRLGAPVVRSLRMQADLTTLRERLSHRGR